jgi:hypothetical protein
MLLERAAISMAEPTSELFKPTFVSLPEDLLLKIAGESEWGDILQLRMVRLLFFVSGPSEAINLDSRHAIF